MLKRLNKRLHAITKYANELIKATKKADNQEQLSTATRLAQRDMLCAATIGYGSCNCAGTKEGLSG